MIQVQYLSEGGKLSLTGESAIFHVIFWILKCVATCKREAAEGFICLTVFKDGWRVGELGE